MNDISNAEINSYVTVATKDYDRQIDGKLKQYNTIVGGVLKTSATTPC